MEGFTEILQTATAHLEEEYFKLPIDGGDPVYRERVYCYELYHQIRKRWPPGCEYFLNGEVDKGGHPYFQELGAPKPDYIVHVPGTDYNYAAIEVKAAMPNAAAIRTDVDKLVVFRGLGYERALYLIYGCDYEQAAQAVTGAIQDPNALNAIELWVHRSVGEEAAQLVLA